MRRRDPVAWSPSGRASSQGRSAGQALLQLFPYLWPKDAPDLRFRVILAVLFLIGAKGANVVAPLLYKGAVDFLSPMENALLALPIALIAGYGLARVLAGLFSELRDIAFARVAQGAIRTIALKLFRHLHGLSLRFHLDRQTGGVTRAIERGSKGIEFLLNFMLFNIIPTLIEIVLVCGILWKLYGAMFALSGFATIAAYIVFTLSVTEWRIKYRRIMNETDNEAATRAIDSLLNYETVKYFGNEDHEARRFDTSLARYEDAAVKSKTSLAFLNAGQGAIIAVGLTLVMLLAGQGVVDKSMTVGDFVLVNTYLIQLYLPLNFLGFVYREIKSSLADMDTMFALSGITPEVQDTADAKPLRISGGALQFESVDFGYNANRPILKKLSFAVPAGKTVAIVGPSGAGKSTISRLLFRFYDVGAGRIAIDGQDIRQVTQDSLRAAIGIVPQDTVLFNDTVEYNIAYGRPGASKEDIERAAGLARIHDFIQSLPEGYRVRVGERGLKLSGGEKQRVAIARTILKNPSILLFDEATSALDSQTEKEIQQSLREVSENRTTLIIAHRLSTVVHADEILVLEAGEIVERGRHGDLLALGGRYAEMWRRQQETAELEAHLARMKAGEDGAVSVVSA